MGDENNMYLVSVRLMCYNHEKFIREAMDGIMMQIINFKIEVVIGDDFSEDRTLEIIEEYESTENIHIKILDRQIGDKYWIERKKNNRLYNFLDIINNCTGKYIAFLDGDDYWTDPLKLEKQVSEMEKFPQCGLSFHPTMKQIVNSDKKNVVDNRRSKGNYIFSTEQIILGGGAFCSTASIMIKCDIAKKYGPFILAAPAGDYFMQVFGSLKGGALYIDDVMAVYRRNVPGSWSANNLDIEKSIDFNFRMVKARGGADSKLNYKYKNQFLKRDVDVLRKTIKKICTHREKGNQFIFKYINKKYFGKRYMLYIYSSYFITKYKLYYFLNKHSLK